MGGRLFINEAKHRLAAHLYPGRQNNELFMRSEMGGMYVVWLSKIGQNNKCLLGMSGSDDYFEISYFGDEKEFVLDHYTLKKHLYI